MSTRADKIWYHSPAMKRRNIILLALSIIALLAVTGALAFIFWPDPTHIKMVRIKPGTFVMGSPESEPERWGNEVQH